MLVSFTIVIELCHWQLELVGSTIFIITALTTLTIIVIQFKIIRV